MARFDKIKTLADMSGALNALAIEGVRKLTLKMTPDAAASGNVNASGTPANAETITITDGAGTAEVFEFTDGGGASGTNTEVDKSATITSGMAELKAAIDAGALDITTGTVAGAFDLPLTHTTQGAIGNLTVMATDASVLTLTQLSGGVDGNLTAAAPTQVIPFAESIPADAIVLAAAVQVDTLVAGGAISAATIDIGDTGDDDKYVVAENIFGGGTGLKQGAPGVAYTTLAGAPVNPTAIVPDVVIATTGGDVAALDVGDITAILWIASPPVA